jgi:AcrR family transcriptional regulator
MTTSTQPRRTQAERTQASREKIIREATRLFGQSGFRGAKLSEIAAAAGLTEPGLLHHFPSKEHLLMGVLEERDRLDDLWVQETMEMNGGRLLETSSELVRHNEGVPGLVQLFTILAAESVSPEHPAHDYFVGRYRISRARFSEAVRDAQERGEVRADIEAEELVILIYALMDGLQLQWLLEPEKVSMPKVFDTFVRILKGE